jgi:hypothetical protein
MVKIVTREIADYIYKSYKSLRLNGIEPEEAIEKIHSDVENDFNVKISLNTVKFYTDRNFDKIKECQRNYLQRMTKPRNKEIEMTIDVFNGLDVERTPLQVWEKVGGMYVDVDRTLNAYHKAGVLNKERRGNKVFYSLNRESSFHIVADGFFKEREKEMDKQFSVKRQK